MAGNLGTETWGRDGNLETDGTFTGFCELELRVRPVCPQVSQVSELTRRKNPGPSVEEILPNPQVKWRIQRPHIRKERESVGPPAPGARISRTFCPNDFSWSRANAHLPRKGRRN